jgi:hypothetical protein
LVHPGEFAFNNKDKTGVYYDAVKNKKLLLVYDNGRLANQTEMVDENHEDERDPAALKPIKKQREVKEIVSEEVYNSGLYSSEKSLPYVSQFENKMRGTSNTPK